MLQRNTRTLSDPTGHPHEGSNSPKSDFPRRRDGHIRPFSLLSLALLAVFLTACASGNAREADPYATKEAEKTQVVPGAHETAINQRFFPTPGTPEPTATPIVTLESLVLTTSLAADNSPQQEVRGVSGTGTLYADALVHNLTKGADAKAVWSDTNGTVYYSSDIQIKADHETAWLPFQWNIDGSVPRGDYTVYVYVDDWLLNSLVFHVG